MPPQPFKIHHFPQQNALVPKNEQTPKKDKNTEVFVNKV